MGTEDDHSVFNEPHLNPDLLPQEDGTEEKAEKTLGRERHPENYLQTSGQGIHDELDIFPGRRSGTIDRDWSCSKCGYNLRGLASGSECPGCGKRQFFKPPPAGVNSYAKWLKSRIEAASPAAGWALAFSSIIGGGIVAVAGTMFWGMHPLGLLSNSFVMVCFFGPAIEEVMKISLVAWIIEQSPYRFQKVEQIQFATIGAALLFAIIENLLYIYVYIKNPGPEIILWRWLVCTSLHVGCTTIATRGLVKVWRRSVDELRRPEITQWIKPLTAAIFIHSAYNTCVLLYETLP